MKVADTVRVHDQGSVTLHGPGGDRRVEWGFGEKSVVEVQGWVTAVLRERGKIVRRYEGHNIWTNTGREYLSMLMSRNPANGSHYRTDQIGFIGVGTGLQVENTNVFSLVTPIPYSGGDFLAPLDLGAQSFPLAPSRTTVQYSYTFAEDEITTSVGSSVVISEMGLFTDGNQDTFAEGGRDVVYYAGNMPYQSPVAYKAFEEGITKTDAFALEVNWQIRF